MKRYQHFWLMIAILVICQIVASAPVQKSEGENKDHSNKRRGKNLGFYDYFPIQPDFTAYANYDTEDYTPLEIEDNEISRTIPTRKAVRPRPQVTPFNSPIYYIRMPPQPYMFVPGLGYISQPPPSPVSQFVNLPVNFVANGKPNTIYQWSGGVQNFPTVAPPPLPVVPQKPLQAIPQDRITVPQKPKPQKPAQGDSHIHRLPGQYVFNGKPEDIFVLSDSYNSVYSDALQNFYP